MKESPEDLIEKLSLTIQGNIRSAMERFAKQKSFKPNESFVGLFCEKEIDLKIAVPFRFDYSNINMSFSQKGIRDRK